MLILGRPGLEPDSPSITSSLLHESKLEVERSDVADERVASSRVVEVVDVAADGSLGAGPGRPAVAMNELLLHGGKEALGDRVDAPIDVKERYAAFGRPAELGLGRRR
jgi:hypothetical protein